MSYPQQVGVLQPSKYTVDSFLLLGRNGSGRKFYGMLSRGELQVVYGRELCWQQELDALVAGPPDGRD